MQAQKIRRMVQQDFVRAFESCDLIMLPTVTQLVPPIIENVKNARNPVDEYIYDVLIVPASLAVLPALSVPFGVASFVHGTVWSRQVVAASRQVTD